MESLFSHPLKSFLTTEAPFPHEQHLDEVPYYSYQDVPWLPADRDRPVRMHRFLTGREAGGVKPVFGLTACVEGHPIITMASDHTFVASAILIRVAMIGYDRAPDFDIAAPGQPPMIERIDYALQHSQRFRRAFAEDANQSRARRGKRTPRNPDKADDEHGDDLWTARSKL